MCVCVRVRVRVRVRVSVRVRVRVRVRARVRARARARVMHACTSIHVGTLCVFICASMSIFILLKFHCSAYSWSSLLLHNTVHPEGFRSNTQPLNTFRCKHRPRTVTNASADLRLFNRICMIMSLHVRAITKV